MEKTFTFSKVPESLDEMKLLPESDLSTPLGTAALTLLCLCNFETAPDSMFEMLEFLNGPDTLTPYTRQFLKDRLNGKAYKVFSFFRGAKPDNGYTPDCPYQITVSENPHTYDSNGYATVYVKSSGADSPRPIRLRLKPSTHQWFVSEIQCLSDIRTPVNEDPWA